MFSVFCVRCVGVLDVSYLCVFVFLCVLCGGVRGVLLVFSARCVVVLDVSTVEWCCIVWWCAWCVLGG